MVLGRVSAWLRTWWLVVPVPRELSVAYTCVYVVAALTGLVTLVLPPVTISAEIGSVAMSSMGVLLLVGAAIGMVGGAMEHWKLERIGLFFMASAITIYGLLVGALHFSSEGSRLTQLGVVVLALAVFVVRFLMIRRYTFRPRG